MRPGIGAVLVPAINTTAWEQGVGCRVKLFWDWGWEEVGQDGERNGNRREIRFAEVMKVEGTAGNGGSRRGRGRVIGFVVGETGLLPISLATNPTIQSPNQPNTLLPLQSMIETPQLPRKRKLSETDLEIRDSEEDDDEDYGWAEEDEEVLPEMPPQWQGSEDVLVPGAAELEEIEEEEEEELVSVDKDEGEENTGDEGEGGDL